MGSITSSSSISSSTDNKSDCYIRNKMMREQCLQTRLDNENINNPKSYLNNAENLPSMTNTDKTQFGCDCQGNVVECDENGRIIRIIKQNNR